MCMGWQVRGRRIVLHVRRRPSCSCSVSSMVPLRLSVPLFGRFACRWPDVFPLVVIADAVGRRRGHGVVSGLGADWLGEGFGCQAAGEPGAVALTGRRR
ncbi:hypothetical protein ADK94_27215 [Streptomyces sp. XY593]|nr:hypothetical protein ADK94_27215 [Streptomyces sp. XY593]